MRPQGSPEEYENAQKRILEVFSQWKAPDNFKIELFVVRVGEWGGHMLVECDDPLAVHKACTTFPAFEFQARPVVPIEDAVRVEQEMIAWRDYCDAREDRHALILITYGLTIARLGDQRTGKPADAFAGAGTWRDSGGKTAHQRAA